MSTLATADLGSDDEDGDFVPQAKGKRTRTGSQSDSSGDEDDAEPEDDMAAKLRQEAEAAAAEARKKRAADAFKAMQEESKAVSAPAPKEVKEEVEMVEVRRPRRFAGETIYETVKLRRDDPEAVRYLAQGREAGEKGEAGETDGVEASEPASVTPAQALPPDTATATATATATPPAPRRAPRKRPRQSLEAMSAALDKGKKMSTLEKSQMDWNTHMASDARLADEVAQNRRGGGYLEKQEFLDRVGERRDNATGRRR